MLSRLSIGHKLFLGLGLLIVTALAIAALGIVNMSSVQSTLVRIVDGDAERVRLAGRINQTLLAMARDERNLVLADDTAEMRRFAERFEANHREAVDRTDGLARLVTDAGRDELADFRRQLDEYTALAPAVRNLSLQNGDGKAYLRSRGDGAAAYEAASAILTGLGARLEDAYVAANQDTAAAKAALLAARIDRAVVEMQRAERGMILAETLATMDRIAARIEEGRKVVVEGIEA